MLNTIHRHMLGRLIGAVLMVGGVIAAVQILRKSLPLYGLVVSGALSYHQLPVLWLNLLPVVFAHATAEIASIAVAWMYYRWIENNEILTLRAAGWGCAAIARPGVIVAVLAASFCAVNSLYLLAPSWRTVQDIVYDTLGHVGVADLQPGYQQGILPGVSLSFARRGPDGSTLEDVVVLDRRKQHKAVDIWARRGGVSAGAGEPALWLEDGIYLIRRDKHQTDKVAFTTFSVPLTLDMLGDQSPRINGLYEQPVLRLLLPPAAIRQDPLKSAAWQAEGHRRLINPLLCCGSVVLVLGLLVPGRQGRRAAGRARFVLAMILGIATNTLPNPLFEFAVRDAALLPLLYLLPTAPGIIGVLLLIRGDGSWLRFAGWRGLPRWRPRPVRPLVEGTV
jgi:lipopolysaccharide export LptBFGC system permease protein LptF